MRALLFLLLASPAAARCPVGFGDGAKPPLEDVVARPWTTLQMKLKTSAARCEKCAPGAVTARGSDGVQHCVGGKPALECPGGTNVAVHRWGRPVMCHPCPDGLVSWIVDALPVCAASCPNGEVSVPVMGPMLRFECVEPRNAADSIDWEAARGHTLSEHPPLPDCPPTEGLTMVGPVYACEVCKQGEQPLPRLGRRVCARQARNGCPAGQAFVISPFGYAPVACVSCPEGSKPAPSELGPVCASGI